MYVYDSLGLENLTTYLNTSTVTPRFVSFKFSQLQIEHSEQQIQSIKRRCSIRQIVNDVRPPRITSECNKHIRLIVFSNNSHCVLVVLLHVMASLEVGSHIADKYHGDLAHDQIVAIISYQNVDDVMTDVYSNVCPSSSIERKLFVFGHDFLCNMAF